MRFLPWLLLFSTFSMGEPIHERESDFARRVGDPDRQSKNRQGKAKNEKKTPFPKLIIKRPGFSSKARELDALYEKSSSEHNRNSKSKLAAALEGEWAKDLRVKRAPAFFGNAATADFYVGELEKEVKAHRIKHAELVAKLRAFNKNVQDLQDAFDGKEIRKETVKEALKGIKDAVRVGVGSRSSVAKLDKLAKATSAWMKGFEAQKKRMSVYELIFPQNPFREEHAKSKKHLKEIESRLKKLKKTRDQIYKSEGELAIKKSETLKAQRENSAAFEKWEKDLNDFNLPEQIAYLKEHNLSRDGNGNLTRLSNGGKTSVSQNRQSRKTASDDARNDARIDSLRDVRDALNQRNGDTGKGGGVAEGKEDKAFITFGTMIKKENGIITIIE